MEEIKSKLLELKGKNIKTYELIKKIIDHDKWFLKMDLDTFLNIMKTLGYSKEESLKKYEKMIINLED